MKNHRAGENINPFSHFILLFSYFGNNLFIQKGFGKTEIVKILCGITTVESFFVRGQMSSKVIIFSMVRNYKTWERLILFYNNINIRSSCTERMKIYFEYLSKTCDYSLLDFRFIMYTTSHVDESHYIPRNSCSFQ